MTSVHFRAVAVVTLVLGVAEEYVVGKQDGVCYKRDVGVPEEIMVEKIWRSEDSY